jgi:hypothetical protein
MAEQELVVPLRPRRPRALAGPGLSQDVRPRRYPLAEDDVLCDVFEIADRMPQMYARAVGWTRTAAPWAAQDAETDIVYLHPDYCVACRQSRSRSAVSGSRRPKATERQTG